MKNKPVKKVVVVGGGTAGWLAAASIAKLLGDNLQITLIESDEIGTIGVGEATIPTMLVLHHLLKINEQEFMSAVHGSFKLGISFENWGALGDKYIHSFGVTGKGCWAAGFHHFWLKARKLGLSGDYGNYCTELMAAKSDRFAVSVNNEKLNYAYHFDAGLYANFMRKIAEESNVRRLEGKIINVVTDEVSGFISAVRLDSGQRIEGDLFVDCSGFASLIIDKTLNTEYDDWSNWLPCDRAIAIQTSATSEPVPYTRSIAKDAGWQWRIPLQSRVGNGLVYCSSYITDADAESVLLSSVDGNALTKPRLIKFRTGQRKLHWNKNCIALGLAAGFVEPLESTSIHMVQKGIIRLLQMFPFDGIKVADKDEFNHQMREEFLFIRDFIVLHYHLTKRTDTNFWNHCRSMAIPETLRHRLELFRESGRIFEKDRDLFAENSWAQVMLGQGLMPAHYHPIVNMMADAELTFFLNNIESQAINRVTQLPKHQHFIDKYCKAIA
ncbi:MAG: tryptophan halogenase [Cellvibrionales bacterium TMED49]|nr:tryptophan halogenase [Porticoccaceae bacterium]OUU37721.1 MAG: tryptophan halogenase [Cellvibrionales bacterium TMED49]